MRLKALALVMFVLCFSVAIGSMAMLSHSQASAPKNRVTASFADIESGPVVTPMGPIDTPGGPT